MHTQVIWKGCITEGEKAGSCQTPLKTKYKSAKRHRLPSWSLLCSGCKNLGLESSWQLPSLIKQRIIESAGEAEKRPRGNRRGAEMKEKERFHDPYTQCKSYYLRKSNAGFQVNNCTAFWEGGCQTAKD